MQFLYILGIFNNAGIMSSYLPISSYDTELIIGIIIRALMIDLGSGHPLLDIIDLCISLTAEEDPISLPEGKDFSYILTFQQSNNPIKEAITLEVNIVICDWIHYLFTV